jgi:signal transduction histidine kinase
MKMQKNLSHQKEREAGHAPQNFFRELEIEFLLHELKDPISIIETGMRTLLEKQEKYGPLSSRQEKTLKRTLRNTKKVREMLNGLLEIGRSGAGYVECSRFQVVETVYGVLLDTLETGTGALPDPTERHVGVSEGHPRFRGVEKEAQQFLAEYRIFLDLPPQVMDIELVQDETKVRQIFGNLLKNALYHRKERIDITMKREADYLVIDVTDDGPGIEPKHHQTVFQRYTQLKASSSVSRKGHGLGLAGALILARCLGGDIELKSTKGQGATFRLILPVILENVLDNEPQ